MTGMTSTPLALTRFRGLPGDIEPFPTYFTLLFFLNHYPTDRKFDRFDKRVGTK